MDASSVVVVLLFVYAIFSSLGGPGPVSHVAGSDQPEAQYLSKSESGALVSDPLLRNLGELPPADYLELDEEAARLKLRHFILSYAKDCSEEDASEISRGLIKYSQTSNVNTFLLAAILARESRFNPNAISSHGAQGLGQLLPSTARYMGIDDPFDIAQNIKGTAKYFRYLLDKWRGQESQVPLAIASYLEGPNAIKDKGLFRNHSVGYIKDILVIYRKI